MLRDRLLAWPARVGPLVAAAFEIDATALTLMLEDDVRQHSPTLPANDPSSKDGLSPRSGLCLTTRTGHPFVGRSLG
jgi:hypothetical protein